MMYDLAIIGGGPAGVAAGVYASRKRLKTIFITKDFGGQSIDSVGIENWIGTINIPGPELAKDLEKHLRAYATDPKTGEIIVDIKTNELCEMISKSDQSFTIKTNKASYEARTVLTTAGSHRRKLGIPGADTFEHKGLTYCASCDGPLFAGQDVVVVGGGNAGFESAAQLLAYCKTVTLLNRSSGLRADPSTVASVKAAPNMKLVLNAVPKEVKGDTFVTSIVYSDMTGVDAKDPKTTGHDIELPATGIFVEIGALPTTEFVRDLVKLDDFSRVIVDPRTQRTSVDGIWAAGDCTDGLYHQNNIAAGDAVKALEDIYIWVQKEKNK
jgi:alkyl hydroperoxide reductase subunit F